ncbi:11618_t:CDS:1, partial [Funneliformis caledonium]
HCVMEFIKWSRNKNNKQNLVISYGTLSYIADKFLEALLGLEYNRIHGHEEQGNNFTNLLRIAHDL